MSEDKLPFRTYHISAIYRQVRQSVEEFHQDATEFEVSCVVKARTCDEAWELGSKEFPPKMLFGLKKCDKRQMTVRL